MQRMHSTTSLMGQNRWWLKLFFYLLDVGTANALILFRLSMKGTTNEKMNMLEFKKKLLTRMLGTKILDVYPHVESNHELVRCADKHHLCTYCFEWKKQKNTVEMCTSKLWITVVFSWNR